MDQNYNNQNNIPSSTDSPASSQRINNSDSLKYETPSSGQNQQGMGSNNSKKKIGPIIVTLVVVLVIIIAALYIFASKVNHEQPPEIYRSEHNTVSTNNNEDVSVQPITNKSDDVQSLQDDLNKSVEGLDSQDF